MLRLSRAVAGAFFVLVFASAGVRAAEVKVLAVGVFPGAFKELVPQFERASGHKVTVQYGATPGLIKQIEAGETFDVAILITGPMNEAATKGYFAAGARPQVSSVGFLRCALARRSRTFRRLRHSNKRCSRRSPSPSFPESVNGKHFLSVFDRIGIGEEMKARIKPQKAPDEVAQAVAKGEADFALFVSNQFDRSSRRRLCRPCAQGISADAGVCGRSRRQGQGA